jgi:hypothetical protein
MNSSTFNFLLSFFGGETRQQFEVGLINKVPVPPLSGSIGPRLGNEATRAANVKRQIDTTSEISHAFICPAALIVPGTTLIDRSTSWTAHLRASAETLASIQAEIDDLAFRLYRFDDADRAVLAAPLTTESTDDTESELDEDEEATTVNTAALTANLLSYTLGTFFGRWDIRCATGEKSTPELLDL